MSRNVVVFAAFWLFSGAVFLLSTNKSAAQIVNISPGGGVHVRAPFVRVDVYPYGGGVSVRAPFAAVDVPRRPYYYRPGPMVIERPVVRPRYFTAQELAAFDDETLRRILQTNADRLYERLARFDTGATWQRYLRLRNDLFSDSLSEDRPEEFSALLQRFRDVAADPQYTMIAELPDFAAVQAVLAEVTSRLRTSPEAIGTQPEELPVPSNPVQPTEKRSFMQPK